VKVAVSGVAQAVGSASTPSRPPFLDPGQSRSDFSDASLRHRDAGFKGPCWSTETCASLLTMRAIDRGTLNMNTTTRKGSARVGYAALLALIAAAVSCKALAGTIDHIRQEKVIRIAYRTDAPPFSYKDKLGEPAGFMVDLCRAVAKNLTQQLSLPSLSVSYVVVSAGDRFEAIQQNKADLLCEPTSVTLSRRGVVDFSIATFVDGASLMIGPDGPHNLQALAGRKVGVLAGTTTEEALRNSLSSAGITADVIPAKTHAEGLAMLDGDQISAYFADRSILLFLIRDSKAAGKLRLADVYLTVEPYALALPRGDEDFRLEVDRALSHIYRSAEIGPILVHSFGENVQMGPMLQMVYAVSGLPD
jgi:ABC-type amino acid transport substrate-binding protein